MVWDSIQDCPGASPVPWTSAVLAASWCLHTEAANRACSVRTPHSDSRKGDQSDISSRLCLLSGAWLSLFQQSFLFILEFIATDPLSVFHCALTTTARDRSHLHPTYLERRGEIEELTEWVRKFSHQEFGLPLEVLFLAVWVQRPEVW